MVRPQSVNRQKYEVNRCLRIETKCVQPMYKVNIKWNITEYNTDKSTDILLKTKPIASMKNNT